MLTTPLLAETYRRINCVLAVAAAAVLEIHRTRAESVVVVVWVRVVVAVLAASRLQSHTSAVTAVAVATDS